MLRNNIIYLLVMTAVSVNTQGIGFFGFGGGFGFGSPSNFQNIALQSAANKLSAQNLPEDLQARLTDTLTNAELRFANCETVIYWQYRRCSAWELKNAMNQLNAIEDEVKLRRSTTTVVVSPSDPAQFTPAETAASASPEPAPAASVSTEPSPAGSDTAESAPAASAPAEPAPVVYAPAEPAPVASAPAEPAPTSSVSAEPAPNPSESAGPVQSGPQ